jgi:RNA 2',3'-cyclic 3'-phosphodiesterase
VRLFVALVPPPEAMAELESAVAPLRPGWPRLRWTSQAAWHVTLAFLGEVGEARLAALADRLERAASRHPSQVTSIRDAGAFPSAARGRVLWVGIHGHQSALAALAGSVAAGARRAGAPSPDEGRRYRPHLTLARCREPADLGPLVEPLGGFVGSAWVAGQIYLIQSHPGPRPRYDTVGCWPLRQARPD